MKTYKQWKGRLIESLKDAAGAILLTILGYALIWAALFI